VLGWEVLAKWVSSNNTNLVLDPRQAPEHSKSPMLYNLSIIGWYIKL
jgi:hypothetical protein